MNYSIRHFQTHNEYAELEKLMTRIWGSGTEVASPIAIAIDHHDGCVLGAFENGTGQLLGAVMSFLRFSNHPGASRGLAQHSHIAGVLPEAQGHGIGEALKRAQADFVRAQGLNLITWTYDPIEARNAWLNVGKLRCICRTFIENLYGLMEDELNRGLPSDRFEVEWWLDDARPRPDVNGPYVEVEIPSNFQALKKMNMDKAWSLRMALRERFESLFADGYAVFEFIPDRERPRYGLWKVRE